MRDTKYNLIKLTKKECEAIEEWLNTSGYCLDELISDHTHKDEYSHRICLNVFGEEQLKDAVNDRRCPCSKFGTEYVEDVAISLLEYNDYEINNDIIDEIITNNEFYD